MEHPLRPRRDTRGVKMSEVKVILHLDNADVYLNLSVELHSGCTEEDLNGIARQLFPHLDPHHVYAELTGGNDE